VFNFADGAEADVAIDRIVWLAPQKPGAMHSDRNKVYYNRAASTANVHLLPGTYAVIGPSRTTAPGSPRSGDNVTVIGWHGTTAPQEVQLTGAFHVTDNAGGNPYPSTTDEIHPPLGIAVGGDRSDYDATWDATNLGPIGLSVSEPLFSGSYYPSIAAPSAINETTYNLNTPAGMRVYDVYEPVRPEPLDTATTLGVPTETGTTTNFRTVLLQRLADPTQPYNGITNPYITVDWMPMDLTVFNGQWW
jgi:hypothetical protein